MARVFWMKQRMYQTWSSKTIFLEQLMHRFPCHIIKKSSWEEWYLVHWMIFREIGISRVTGKFSITFWKPYWSKFFSVSTSSDTKETSQPIVLFSWSIWYSGIIHWTNCIIGPLVTMCCLKTNIQILLYQQDKAIWLPDSITALLKKSPFYILFCLSSLYLLLLNSWLFFPGIPLKVCLFVLNVLFFCPLENCCHLDMDHKCTTVSKDQWSGGQVCSTECLDFVMTTACLATSINYFSWSRSDSFTQNTFNL